MKREELLDRARNAAQTLGDADVDVAVDDDAKVSVGRDGYWVQAWMHLRDDHPDESLCSSMEFVGVDGGMEEVPLRRDQKLKGYVYLDLSTGHMTKEDRDLLQGIVDDPKRSPPCPLFVIPYDCGWFVHVISSGCPEDIEALATEGFSPHFQEILRIARDSGCWFVRFDSDGAVYDHLPRFEW